MQSLYLRLGQATPLTYSQEDENFKRIKSAIDALEIQVAGAGLGTVTSVGLALPNIFTVSGSPVTTAGSLTASLAIQTQNLIFASPDGTSGQPTFRALLNADLPTVSIAKGGLGLTTVATNNQIIASNGTSYEGRTISVGTGLTLTQGTGSVAFALDLASINITSLGGVLTTPQGGTGVSTAPANGELLIGNGTVWQKATLTAGSGISITNGAGSITISTSLAGVGSLNGLTGVLAIGVGTTGTDVNVTTPTSSGITLNIPSASASNRGALTSTDWSTFNGKVGGSGTSGTLPIFSGSNTISNSLLTYTSSFGTGTIDFASGESNAVIKSTGTVSAEVEARGAGSNFTKLAASASGSALVWTSGKILQFLQGTTDRAGITANGVLYSNNGVALNGVTYYNTVGGSSTSIANNSYGVIIGSATASAVTVTLPSSPENGQEVVIVLEASKDITAATGTGKLIFGKSSTASTTLILNITINTHASTIIFKYFSLGNSGAGAWYLTGF